MTIPRSVRPVFFFSKTFYIWTSMTIPQSLVCETVVWSLTFMVENVFEKKMKKTLICETVVWSMADRVKNLIEKKDRSVRQWYGQWQELLGGYYIILCKIVSKFPPFSENFEKFFFNLFFKISAIFVKTHDFLFSFHFLIVVTFL